MVQFDMAARRSNSSAASKPADAAAGAPFVRKYMLKLFDREDGTAADWPLIAETLLAVAFDALDHAPDDARTVALLRRFEGGAYNRLTGNSGADELTGQRPSIAAAFHNAQPAPDSAPR